MANNDVVVGSVTISLLTEKYNHCRYDHTTLLLQPHIQIPTRPP